MKNRKKPIVGKNYGSIPHLSDSKLGKHDKFIHEGQERIIRNGGRDQHDAVIVSLKLDGTNVGVVKKDGRLISLQRKGLDCASSPYRQHHEFDKWMHENYDRFDALLYEGERIVGEWMWQASGIKYVIKNDPFFAFDIFMADGRRSTWAEVVMRCESVFIECPPATAYTVLDHKDNQYQDYYLTEDCGITPEGFNPSECDDMNGHEGLVFRVERKGKYDFMAKWVRPDFEPGKYLPGIGLPVGAEPVQNILL